VLQVVRADDDLENPFHRARLTRRSSSLGPAGTDPPTTDEYWPSLVNP
jgi:hypothetical protein